MSVNDMYNGMRVMMLSMEKGGTGKSTLGGHIAMRAAQGGLGKPQRVLLIDFDGQQNVSRLFLDMKISSDKYVPPVHPDYDPNEFDESVWNGRSNSVDIYFGNEVLPYNTSFENLDIIPSDGSILKQFEEEGKQNALDKITENMRNFLASEDVQAAYDLVIVDLPPGKSIITAPIFRICTDVLMPFEPAPWSVDGMNKMYNTIKKENSARKYPINILGFIPNRYIKSYSSQNVTLELVRDPTKFKPAEHVVDFEIAQRAGILLESLPARANVKHKLKGDAETMLKKLMSHISDKMSVNTATGAQ